MLIVVAGFVVVGVFVVSLAVASAAAGKKTSRGAGAALRAPCGTKPKPPPRYKHVVWIVMENKGYSDVIGSSSAPYINSVAQQCGVATNFYAESSPSLPNYIAMTSGSTQGISDDEDPSSHRLAVPSIFSQLAANWRALEESMPSRCRLSNAGLYAVRHNPATYYTRIRRQCVRRDVPLTYPLNLSAKFTFVTPNLCDDMHSCPTAPGGATDKQIRNGDTWLSTFCRERCERPVSLRVNGRFPDLGTEDGGGHIPTLVITPSVTPGTTSSAAFTHYSLLRTTEQMLGIRTYLGRASSARSMRGAFHI